MASITDTLVVLSKSQMRELVDTYNIASEEKFKIIPLGFDFSSFHPKSFSIEDKRKAWQLTSEHYICGFIGRLEPVKNPLLFVKALHQLVVQREIRSKDVSSPPTISCRSNRGRREFGKFVTDVY